MATNQDAPEPASGPTSPTVGPADRDVSAAGPIHQPSASAFWHRVKEHKVAQWTIAYGAAAYTLLHIVEMVSDALDWPHLIVRIVTLSLILGTPVAATLAWYHGYRALRRVSGPELAILTILLLIAGSVLWFLGRPRDEHARAVQATVQQASVSSPQTIGALPDRSIAVLPFVNLSDDKGNEYFSDGLSEELIDMLTKVSDLRVPARTSSFYFKGKQATIPEIAKALSVSHLLEGSVRKSGNHLRITAQLVRADNGYHVWSETYDRELDDIFKIQDDIAAAVVTSLKATLLKGGARPAVNTEAYTLFLQAREVEANLQTPQDHERSIAFLERALELDPKFARAWALLAAYRATSWHQFTQGNYQQARGEALSAAQQALKLEPTLSDAHVAMGRIYFDLDWEWVSAAHEIDEALTANPGDVDALSYAGRIALLLGRPQEAVRLTRKGLELDPLNAWYISGFGNALLVSGQPTEAEAAYRRALELAPKMGQLRFCFGWTLLALHKPAEALVQMEQETDTRYQDVGRALVFDALGRKADANTALAAAEANYPSVVEYPIAAVYANRGDSGRAFKWLDRAYELHDGWVWWMTWDPLLSNLRLDPRYKALLRRINVPE